MTDKAFCASRRLKNKIRKAKIDPNVYNFISNNIGEIIKSNISNIKLVVGNKIIKDRVEFKELENIQIENGDTLVLYFKNGNYKVKGEK